MNEIQRTIFEEIAETLDIPEGAYEKAEARYKSLGDWFGRPEAKCANFSPLISPQGSFRLGTVVRAGEYDLDFTCKLREGIGPHSHSQFDVKRLVGEDMAEYRAAHNIKAEPEEKQRCWRLQYADVLPFHMDGVPAIPHDSGTRSRLEESMVKLSAFDQGLASRVAEHACAITDNSLANFRLIDPGWLTSNPEGYALWFDSRIQLARFERGDMIAGTADVVDLPKKLGNAPLQLGVKILKRHRDLMFADNEKSKPISIIITTLAAQAYRGETNVADAIRNALASMETLLRSENYGVPNPVNPAENFADKWTEPNRAHLRLAENFQRWVRQARIDFDTLAEPRDERILLDGAGRFGGRVDPTRFRAVLGSVRDHRAPAYQITNPPKPWSRTR